MDHQKIATFFMFSGRAMEAMNFYTTLFDNSEINKVLYHEDGTVLHAIFTLNGQTYMCIDSKEEHNFNFTPSISLFITCETAEEIDALYQKLSEEGTVLMPICSTPVSEKYAWVNDKFGVSWQLMLITSS
ncbi:putative 3-demethylubiquinone-9 3-methyltransferase (glyoxalase superfamily) [Paenibacillus anaericanus]|uniref:VOC family protein n=1 Tax=Paenibacillus anaericanus TaxID=170367 RepID=A0A3S1BEV1_9BACL|nr:VOC family protein [Paenibacillus anaericanus]MDQ0086899.1 putative 3-demethylubiquinone-9 3-methyltransferase (glyoxalase superfamily) [Paenibacillus anaericanus]RUT37900.1 VOC family protein [Paenibacillus anaericanus]